MDVIEIIASILGLAIGIIVGYFIRKNISETKIGEAKALANDIIDKANKDSETIKKEKLLEAKEEIHKWRTDAENEQKERRKEVQNYERRVLHKEQSIERKQQNLETKESTLNEKSTLPSNIAMLSAIGWTSWRRTLPACAVSAYAVWTWTISAAASFPAMNAPAAQRRRRRSTM